MAGFQDTFSDLMQDSVPALINNSGAIFNVIVTIVIALIALGWIYFGLVIFNDARKRFNITNVFFYFALMIVGVLFGPIAWIIYKIFRPRRTKEDIEFTKVEHKFYYHQASKVIDCIKCGAYVLEGHLHCTNCGTQNRFKCESCKTVTDYDDLYCSNCGKSFEGRYEKVIAQVNGLKKKAVNTNKSKTKENSDSIPKTSPVSKVKDSFKNFKNYSSNKLKQINSKLSKPAGKEVSTKKK
jgi:transcription elongation factor Elf1